MAALTAPLDLPKLHTLQQFTHAILAITAERGHTKKLLIRESCSTIPLQHGESLYRYHSGPQSYHPVSEVPSYYNDDEKYLAIHLTQANFRVVLYSLDSASVIQEINSLKSKSKVDSWTMRGSNFLTRNLSKQTAENCASIVYLCLRAGGFPTFFKSKSSSQTSSVISPDDLLRHLVAFKDRELEKFPKTRLWITSGISITVFNEAKEAYKQIGQNANVEEDVFPAIKPSFSICSVM